MKVLVRSERVPVVLMIIGTALLIASSLSCVVRNEDLLLPLGAIIGLVGFLTWMVPSLQRYIRKKKKAAAKRERQMMREEDRPRRYAKPRR